MNYILKKISYFLLFFLYAIVGNAQKIQLIAIQGPLKDTVIIGFDENATLGIDLDMGEQNIFEEVPNVNIDLRVLQRNFENFACLYSGYPDYDVITYNENFDSKINLRKVDSILIDNLFFEIKSNSTSLTDILIKSDNDIFTIIDKILISQDTCEIFKSETELMPTGMPINVFQIQSDLPIYSLVIKFAPIAPLNSNGFLNPKENIMIYPNPTNSILYIQEGYNKISKIDIYNVNGEKVISSNEQQIYVQTLTSGVYFVKFYTDKLVFTSKFIKI